MFKFRSPLIRENPNINRNNNPYTHEMTSVNPSLEKQSTMRAIDSFVYMVPRNMIGRGKTKTKKFGRGNWDDLDLVHGNVHGGHIGTRQHHGEKYTQK